ncbi:MAG: hypothetical protein WH035_01050 [Spirochaetota bacterium]
MKDKKLLYLFLFIFFIIFFITTFLSMQNNQTSNVSYNDLLIFFNDPINSLPNLALKYNANSLFQYFSFKGVKAYIEFPLSLEAAFKIAKEKDLKYLLEIKSNLLSYSRSSSGYSVKLEVIVSVYILNDPNSKFSSVDTGISENALSSDIAFAYAFYDGSIKAINKIETDLLNLLKK